MQKVAKCRVQRFFAFGVLASIKFSSLGFLAPSGKDKLLLFTLEEKMIIESLAV